MALAGDLCRELENVREALRQQHHPVTCAYLLPFVPDAQSHGLDAAADALLRRLKPGSARHLAVVEAVRLAYQRAAKAADRLDKERHRTES